MNKFKVIVADPPWEFSDKLKMSDAKRSLDYKYKQLDINIIKKLEVKKISANDALLALWVPSSMLQDGLDTMNAWGFEQKQTWIWVKIKKGIQTKRNPQDMLAFGMGHLFRQTHELCLIGTRGKVYNKLKNKSQRSVFFWPVTKHSEKPDGLQDMLDVMFPRVKKLEMFARRDRKGWMTVGLESPSTKNEDIRYTIKRLSS